jgi:hypothetical protein
MSIPKGLNTIAFRNHTVESIAMQNDTETTAYGNDAVRAVAQESAEAQNFTPEITPTLERVARAVSLAHTGLEVWLEGFIDHAQAAIDAAQEWQPIESAPIDACVMVSFYEFDDPTQNQIIAFAQSSDGDNWYEEESHSLIWTPTHWMPIPEPPKQHGNDTQEGNNMARGGL